LGRGHKGVGKMGAKSAIKEVTEKMHKNVAADVEKAVKQATDGGPMTRLKMLAEKNKTGDIIITRKNSPGAGRYAYFHKLEGRTLSDIDPDDFEALCHTEGGGGEYIVKVKVVGQDAVPFGPYTVIGQTRAYPKSSIPDPSAVGPLPGTTSKVKDTNGKETSELMSQMMEMAKGYQQELSTGQMASADKQMNMMMMFAQQQQASADRMMAQQQAASQQLMQVLAAGRESAAGPSDEVKELRDELKEMKEQARAAQQQLRDRELQSKLEGLEKQLADTKLEQLRSDKPDMTTNLMGQLFQAQQASNAQSTDLIKQMMMMAADKPTQSDQITSILSSMIGATSSNIKLMSEAAQAGLLGGSDSPIKDALVRSLEQAVEVLPGVLQNLAGAKLGVPQPQYADQAYVEGEEEMPPPSLPPQESPQLPEAPPATMLEDSQGMNGEAGPMAGVQQAAPAEQPQQLQLTPEQIEDLQRRALTEEEIGYLQRDQALATVLAKIQNGVSSKEISARIWAHKNSPNPVAEKWFEDPAVITYQVIEVFQLGDQNRIAQVTQDLISFKQFVEGGGDPNQWPDTDYRPVKTKKKEEAAEDTSKIQPEEVPSPGELDEGVTVEETPPEGLPTPVNEGVEVQEAPTEE
jgi:hypothetical protein